MYVVKHCFFFFFLILYLQLTVLLYLMQQNDCLRCPTCKTIHGVMKGNQPAGGTMTVTRSSNDIPGYPGCGSIVIVYVFASGTQVRTHQIH